MGRVAGKVALVTGAARGQGRAHAIRLAEEGADIIAVDSCAQIESVPYALAGHEDLVETAKEIEALDRRVSMHLADVRDLAALQDAVAAGIVELGPVDIIVANAGIFSCAPTLEMSAQMWQDMIDVNLTGVFNAVRAAGPSMTERAQGGSIILISSTAGIKGFPSVAHYSAAKHGVVGLMKALAAELGALGIRVNSIHPSTVETDMIKNEAMYTLFRPDLDNPGPEDLGEVLRSLHLLPEAWAQSRDVSNAVLFLASDDARCITGQQLKVDLGFCEK